MLWLHILQKVPRSVLWLLRFPGAGEEHLLRSAKLWAGEDVASRVRFTDVAKKDWHIFRARIVDLFLDTVEVNYIPLLVGQIETDRPPLTVQCAYHCGGRTVDRYTDPYLASTPAQDVFARSGEHGVRDRLWGRDGCA